MKLGLTLRRPEADAAEHIVVPQRGLIIGGLPTVSLLPGELRTAVRERTVKRALGFGVFTVVLIAVGATGLAGVVAANSQTRLDTAQAASQSLLGQIGKFKDVQQLQQSNALARSAIAVGGSTEIDWKQQIDAIEAEMPAGFTVASVTADSATPVADYPQGTTPLELPRAASFQLTATTSSIADLPAWLRKLRSIPAYADATPSISFDPDTGYTVQLTVHLSKSAIMKAPAQGSGK